MNYNFSLLENVTGPIQVIQVANQFTNNLLGIFMLIALVGSIYFGLRKIGVGENPKQIMIATSFSAAIISIFLRILGLVDNYIVTAVIVTVIITFAILWNYEP